MISWIHKSGSSITAAVIAMSMTFLGDVAQPVIHADWAVDLRTVGAVGALVVSGTWWLAKKFQRIEDRLDRAEEARNGMQKALSKLIERNDL